MYHLQSHRVLLPPTAEPIHLDEAKAFLKVTWTSEDSLIASLIEAARQEAEAFLRRALCMQTVEVVADCFPPRGPFYLQKPPLMKFASFEYRDAAGDMQTWDPSYYQVDYRSTPARITPAYAQTWPDIRGSEDINSIVLTYQAGYDVPVTVDADADKLSAAGHPFADNDVLRVRNSGGSLPAGLTKKTDYYVVNAASGDLQLSATQGGSAIDLTDVGSGQHYLYYAHRAMPLDIITAMLQSVAHWYVNREAVVVGTIAAVLPSAARSLLWRHRVMGW